MKEAQKNTHIHIIAGDVGGTNCRFQFGRIDLLSLNIEEIKKVYWKSAAFKNINDAIEKFLGICKSTFDYQEPEIAVFAAAGTPQFHLPYFPRHCNLAKIRKTIQLPLGRT